MREQETAPPKNRYPMQHKDVVSLLKSKNKCLQRFLEVSLTFLDQASSQDFSNLQGFQDQREASLKAIDLYDRKITESIALLPQLEHMAELSFAVEELLQRKHQIVAQIVAVDEKIVAQIELEKLRIQRELNQSQKSKDTVGKFKSAWVPNSGDSLDETL